MAHDLRIEDVLMRCRLHPDPWPGQWTINRPRHRLDTAVYNPGDMVIVSAVSTVANRRIVCPIVDGPFVVRSGTTLKIFYTVPSDFARDLQHVVYWYCNDCQCTPKDDDCAVYVANIRLIPATSTSLIRRLRRVKTRRARRGGSL